MSDLKQPQHALTREAYLRLEAQGKLTRPITQAPMGAKVFAASAPDTAVDPT